MKDDKREYAILDITGMTLLKDTDGSGEPKIFPDRRSAEKVAQSQGMPMQVIELNPQINASRRPRHRDIHEWNQIPTGPERLFMMYHSDAEKPASLMTEKDLMDETAGWTARTIGIALTLRVNHSFRVEEPTQHIVITRIR